MAHHLSADEYRAIFGLRRRTGLVGTALSELRRALATERLRAYQPLHAHFVIDQSTEERARRARAPLVLEARLDPTNRKARRENLARGQEHLRELREDPTFRRHQAQAESAAKGGKVAVACAVCGKAFAMTRSAAADGRRHLCSEPCLREFRRVWAEELRRRRSQRDPGAELVCDECGKAFRGRPERRYCSALCRARAKRQRRRAVQTCLTCGRSFRGGRRQQFCSLACHGRYPRPQTRAKMRTAARQRGRPRWEELCALSAEAFAALSELQRRVVRLYYGLDTREPQTQREVARACEIAYVRVAPLIAEAVSRLLGP